MAIPESDWRALKRLHLIALERFSRRVLNDLRDIVANDARGCHERYLDIYTLIGERNRIMGTIFNDLRRSQALTMLMLMRRHEVITEEETQALSPETYASLQSALKPA